MALDPQVATFLKTLEADPRPGWETMPAPEARQLFMQFEEFTIPREDVHDVEELTFGGHVSARHYKPADDSQLPVVVYFHGGGWVLGNVESHDSTCRRLANQSGCSVISVDYRLAPEFAFPAAIDDCFEAVNYVSRNADELGIDANRIAVAGDSAGGNLAASVALRAMRSGIADIQAQLLIYPATDSACNSSSYDEFAEGFGLTAETMRWFWSQYLQTTGDHRNPLANVSAADSLSILPRTLVLTAEYDVLRDEGEQFAEQLREAGVDCELKRYDGLIHGFFHFTGLFDRGLAAVDESAEWLQSVLNTSD